MAQTFNQQYQGAWNQLKLDTRRRPQEVFSRTIKEDFDTLKENYVDTNGYVITVPQIEDIVHVVPRSLKTPEEIKLEKKQALSNILASPSPDFARTFSTIMTTLDNIQDTTSLIYPAISMLARWAPKVMSRALPVLGWMMLAGDLLDLAIAIGRIPLTGMGGKRLHCEVIRHNPFTKKARFDRVERLRNYKPGIADLIQAAQTTDQVIGVGLNLGPMMGFLMDSFFGVLRTIGGERVRWTTEPPPMFDHEQAGRNALKASSIINSRGQEFSEETHFWSLVMGAVGARLFLPYCYETDIVGSVEDPMSIMIPAPYPTDPLTIDVIKEAGLDVDQGHAWHFNGKKEIPLGDLVDHLVEDTNTSAINYWNRHNKDWYGYVSAICCDQILPQAVQAFDPSTIVEYDDTPISKVVFTMLKAPLLPTRQLTKPEKEEFYNWVMAINAVTKRPPGLMAIMEKLYAMGIPYRQTYPPEREAEADEFFAKDLDITRYTTY